MLVLKEAGFSEGSVHTVLGDSAQTFGRYLNGHGLA